MRTKHKILTFTLVICLLLGFSTVPSFAGSGNYVRVYTVQNYSNAQKVLKQINKQRTKRGLKALKLDKGLCNDAVQRGAEIAIAVPWSRPHRRPNGKLVRSLDSRIIYECCAEGYDTPAGIVKGWMDSPPHKSGKITALAEGSATIYGTLKYGPKYTVKKKATVYNEDYYDPDDPDDSDDDYNWDDDDYNWE